MHMISVTRRHHTALKAMVIALSLAQLTTTMAAPAQSPLLGRIAATVAPNVVFTFDDSGSMSWSFVPDAMGAAVMGVSSMNSANEYPVIVPEDVLPLANGTPPCTAQTHDSSGNQLNTVAGASALNFVKFRSSYHNRLYYNPDKQYRPWRKPDGTEFPLVTTPSKAPIDPRSIVAASTPTGYSVPFVAGTADLTRSALKSPAYKTPTSPAVNWCGSASDSRKFSAALYYKYNATANSYTAVDINDPAVSSFPRTPTDRTDRADCASATSCTRAEELQNFANWFTYYRTRNLLAIGSASRAFAMEKSGLRLGYGRINYTSKVDGAPGTLVRGVRDFSSGTTTRTQFFYDFLYKVPANGGTPLRRAMDNIGQYFKSTANNGPWSTDPATNSTVPHLACRKSYQILMTDGYWNSDQAPTADARKDVDSTPMTTAITNKAGTKSYKYSPTTAKIYQDGYGNTLADVAMYYWVNDLRTDLDNLVEPTEGSDATTDRGDHAFWQHLTTYTVGLGVNGTVDPTMPLPPPAPGWPKPGYSSKSPAAVPEPVGGETLAMVDDLYHAAVNGRGDYVSAQDAGEFEAALTSFLNNIGAGPKVVTGVAMSSVVLTDGSVKYVPSYRSGVWTGDIKAVKSNAKGTNGEEKWSANAQLPDAADRNILTWNPSANAAVPFAPGMPASLRTAAGWGLTAPPSADLINFIRGDRSKEDAVTFRCRGALSASTCANAKADGLGRLGDFVDAVPALVHKNLDMNYEYMGNTAAGSYRSFIRDKGKRKAGVLFAGANDGMLHAFNADSGVEVMAFIPSAVMSKLALLADPQYGSRIDPKQSHRFYVDGPLAEADAYLGGNWTNLLLGSTGAGARSVFAIKVSTSAPESFPSKASFPESSVLWELHGDMDVAKFPARNKLGYLTAPLAVGPLKDGTTWAAIFGNGVDSPDGHAHLFVVNLSTGAVITTIQAGSEAGNGLGGVTLIRDANRMVVGAYAGDVKGNIWRFDLESTNSSNWKVGFGGKALYAAGASKPFTAAPTYLPHPKGGLMVIAGSGKLIHEDDPSTTTVNEDDLTNTSTQTVYGLWDKTRVGEASVAVDAISSTDPLLQQTFTKITTSTAGDYWQLSNNPIAWQGAELKKGWVVDMTLASGQRNIYPPSVVGGVALLGTIAPTGGTDRCENTSAKMYFLLLNPLTGGRTTTSTIAVDGGSTVGAYMTDNSGPPVYSVGLEPKGPVLTTGTDATKGGGGNPFGVQRVWNQIYNYPRQ